MSDSQSYSKVVVALDDEELSRARAYIADAKPNVGKTSKNDVLHVLIKDGWNDMIREWMDKWIAKTSNIEWAEQSVGRKREIGKEIRLSFCMFTLAEFDGGGGKYVVNMDMRDLVRRPESSGPQTVIFVAVDDLNLNNGFFTTVPAGCCVCIDSDEPLWFPATGGGRGLIYWLML